MESTLNFNNSKCGARFPLISFIIKSTAIKSILTKTLLLINSSFSSQQHTRLKIDEYLTFTVEVLEATFSF